MDLTDLEIKNLRWRYPRFFSNINLNNEFQTVSGGDAKHIAVVLRMKAGDKVILSDNCVDYFSEIIKIENNMIVLKIIDSVKNETESTIRLRLFQCVPKGDKLETITQKATELGVDEITPVFSERCVSKPDLKSQIKKTERLQKITEEAAKQSGRGKIPIIKKFTTFNDAIDQFNVENTGIIFYECGGIKINDILKVDAFKTIDIFIGSEGGFTSSEVSAAIKKGIKAATLGNRILRVETASVAAISILMNLTGNM